jgi:hypothetical protein
LQTAYLVNDIVPIASTRTLFLTASVALCIVACDTGDEYTEDGQLVEKTDVRITGVDFGRAADAAGHITDETDTFAPTDTIYAVIHTKGSSPQTILGVYWRNPSGEEIGAENKVIRPVGDTSTLFVQRYIANRGIGKFALDMRVNGKVVKTAKFVVGEEVRDASREGAVIAAPASHSRKSSGFVATMSRAFATTKATLRSAVRSVTRRVAILTGRESKHQSPFEWKGMRAGMRFSELDDLSNPGSPWQRTPLMVSVVGLERSTAVENEELPAAALRTIVDTSANRVFEVSYSPIWLPKDSSNRLAFERDMLALGNEWDKMPGVIRQQTGQTTGPYFFEWATPDSAWKATITYDGSVRRAGRPTSVTIEELHWDERLLDKLVDSLKGRSRDPNSNHPWRPPGY